ncbi:prepilin-type N-terminal cleavage/methylation domain-containing protein [Fredinandcohnia sp. QZ13]|uniref:prepilin-type N-terminal cleavage/methylation domain-containing protein n=1 Tax=Fredinandcohnia sp. QZ13 TaxID=3073144 RepID=UPI0028530FF0|nr:prepilin-type N-terminal cleavage/methylation domain-containing protein [Fredinandcohnia sp. QZ13]MDR4889121.1 prepilin-type N-terminal cleavage/methylation domain-containing protein [Fredinandcohnia sp. QZ13]
MEKCEKGVTLVELLAAISLLSIILLLASSVHLFGQKQMNTQKNEVQIQSQERLASSLITKEIRKAATVEINNPNELTINGTDVYKHEGTIITKNNEEIITNINGFKVSMNGNQVILKIGELPETTIYIRE